MSPETRAARPAPQNPLRRGACVLAALLVFAAGGSAGAQAPPARAAEDAATPPVRTGDLPPARSVLDRHVEAIGGRQALEQHSSTRVRGTFSMPAAGIAGVLELYAARPNKTLLRVTLEGVGEVTEAFDGAHGWSVSPMTGPMLIEGRQLEEKRFDAEYDSELRSDGRYASMRTEEKLEFDGRECYKVVLVRKTGGEDIEFYEVASGLKAGSITTRETPMGTVTGTSMERDYRRFGKLLQPATVHSHVGGLQQVITVTSIDYDDVPPTVFDMPAEIRALLK